MRVLAMLVVIFAVTGCAGKQDYIRPSTYSTPGANVKVIDKSRDAVWNAAVPELGKRFFVINNLDKASGLINISYSGDPEKYVDCGRIISYVKNARGERTYNFAASKAQQSYEIMMPAGLFLVDRTMSLDGRVNLIFEELAPNQTRVTANTKYVVQRQVAIRNVANNVPQTLKDSITFNTGGSAPLGSSTDNTVDCIATGALELEILDAIQ
jgi:hypothetical protein